MRDLQKNQIIAIIIAVACVTGVTLVSLSAIPAIIDPEIEYLPQFGGSYYASDIQDTNGNSSYATTFHNVTFTFLYRHWPGITVIDNVTLIPSEVPISVYVQVTYSDNSSEILTLVVDSPGICLIGISSTLHGVTSAHSDPRVGLATAETEELHSSWVYLVSF